MPFQVMTREDQNMPARWHTLQDDVYVDKDGNPIPKGDPRARTMYARAGRQIPMTEAERLGLVSQPKRRGKGADKQRQPKEDKSS